LRNLPAPLLAHILGDTTTLAYLWKIVRTDGVTATMTSLDEDIVFAGETYMASAGVDPTSVVRQASLQVSNLDLTGFCDVLLAPALESGLWDYARVELRLINYRTASDGTAILLTGRIGQVSWDEDKYTAEFRGLSQHFGQSIIELTSAECRATFGDARCTIDPALHTESGSVVSVADNASFVVSGLTIPDDYISGKISFNSGACSGYSMEIVSCSAVAGGAEVGLFMPMPFAVTAGDMFYATEGCSKLPSRCKTFGNFLNFQGEPFIPGTGKLLERPDAK